MTSKYIDKDGNELYWILCVACGLEYHRRFKDGNLPRKKIEGTQYYSEMAGRYWYEDCEECKNKTSKFLKSRIEWQYENKRKISSQLPKHAK